MLWFICKVVFLLGDPAESYPKTLNEYMLEAAIEHNDVQMVRAILRDPRLGSGVCMTRRMSKALEKGHTEAAMALSKDDRVDLLDTFEHCVLSYNHAGYRTLIDDPRLNLDGAKGFACLLKSLVRRYPLPHHKSFERQSPSYVEGQNEIIDAAIEGSQLELLGMIALDPRTNIHHSWEKILKFAVKHGRFLLVQAVLDRKDLRLNSHESFKFYKQSLPHSVACANAILSYRFFDPAVGPRV